MEFTRHDKTHTSTKAIQSREAITEGSIIGIGCMEKISRQSKSERTSENFH